MTSNNPLNALFSPLNLPPSTLSTSIASLSTTTATFQSMINSRRLPDKGISQQQILWLLGQLSNMDSNNNPNNIGVGEREARIFSSLILTQNLAAGSGHGVGRSGDISASQPKAGGMSIIALLAGRFLVDVIRRGSGLGKEVCGEGVILPVCTGMGLMLSCMALRGIEDSKDSKESSGGDGQYGHGNAVRKNVILWCRCDQKSVLKGLKTAGFEVVVVDTVGRCQDGEGDASEDDSDGVTTDLNQLEALIQTHTTDRILAIVTTTSCFAPRLPDNIPAVAKLSRKYSIYHVVNSAYGLQCQSVIQKLLKKACAQATDRRSPYGVTCVVSSLDKNFLVPVGGSVVYGPQSAIIKEVGKCYPGRGQGQHVVNLLVTLLEMGLEGYTKLLSDRESRLARFRNGIDAIARKFGERGIRTFGKNTISYGMTLRGLDAEHAGLLGSMLFKRCVSGTRVVVCEQERKAVCGLAFAEYGSSCSNAGGYGCSYLTAACAIGMREEEIDLFFARLEAAMTEAIKKQKEQG